MKTAEVLTTADRILALASVQAPAGKARFLEYAETVALVAAGLTVKQRDKIPEFKDWATSFRRLYDKWDVELQQDPMLSYEPAHATALAFHSSRARTRYNRSANRTSKTQTGYAEHYFIATGQHKWRNFPYPPAATCVVGVNFAQYAGGVFEAKLVNGEVDNPLSPMFPVGGKWFYHYDERKHVLQVACTDCAEAGKAGSCKHPKSTIRLLSDQGGWEVLQGAQYNMVHFDEHIAEEFYQEAQQRIGTVTNGCLIITGTPLFGNQAWEQRLLEPLFAAGPPKNLVDPSDPTSAPLVSIHTIDQFAAGLVPHTEIRAKMATMDEYEIESRIYGKAADVAKNPVFNRKKLAEMRKLAKPGTQLELLPAKGDEIFDWPSLKRGYKFSVIETPLSPLRVWAIPEKGGVYVAAVDPAAGLTDGDASVCSILKIGALGPGKIMAELVAQWHGKKNQLEMAEEVLKLAVWYNEALVAIELTGGYGRPVMLKLKDEYFYWNLYRDTTADVAMAEPTLDSRFGVETNAMTKGPMVAVLQYMVQNDLIKIRDEATLQEMAAFEQEKTTSSGIALLNPRYRGTKGQPDDRVMSLVIGASVVQSYKPLHYMVLFGKDDKTPEPDERPEDVAKYWNQVYDDLAEESSQDPFD